MKFAKITGNDISGIFRNRLIRVSVVAILIVPMLYSLCYLAAFWNPYGKLKELPVAVLNLDEGAKLDKDTVNYGGQVVDDLKNNDEVKWSFVTQDDLKEGLQNTQYYSLFTIPADFSQKIVNAKSKAPTVAEIVYTSNQAKNFLASQISGNVEVQLKEKVSASVTKEYVKAAFDGLYDAKDGLQQAADGSMKLDDGISALDGKLPALTNGAEQLADGSSSLNAGLLTLDSGSGALKSGSAQLKNGLGELQDKLPALSGGTNQLLDGAGQLMGGLDELSAKTPALKSGADAVKNGTQTLYTSADALMSGASQVSGGLDQLIAATDSTTDFDNAIAGIKQLAANGADEATLSAALDELQTAYHTNIGAINSGLGSAKNGTDDVTDGLFKLRYTLDASNPSMPDGSPTFAAGVSQLAGGIDVLSDSAAQLKTGSEQLYTGLNSLNAQIPALTDGVDRLADGSKALGSGIDSAASGIEKLYNGSTSLNEGIISMEAQLPALTGGVGQLSEGSAELYEKLSDGVAYIDGNLVNSSDAMAEYVSAPVTISSQPINPVPDYGTGFAPYFIPLSLWVGAILMFFIISPKEDPRFGANSAQAVIGKYFSYAFIGVLQAVMVGAVVLALGLRPNNIAFYFLTIIVMSLCSIAIVQALISLLGDAGRLIAIVFLILQLTADAGTFPLELVPNFFKVLNPFMPFTYCVTALRQAISGSDTMLILKCLGVLAAFLFAFLVISVVFKKRAEKMQDKMEQMKIA